MQRSWALAVIFLASQRYAYLIVFFLVYKYFICLVELAWEGPLWLRGDSAKYLPQNIHLSTPTGGDGNHERGLPMLLLSKCSNLRQNSEVPEMKGITFCQVLALQPWNFAQILYTGGVCQATSQLGCWAATVLEWPLSRRATFCWDLEITWR